MTRLRERWAGLALITFGLLTGLFLAEFGLRLYRRQLFFTGSFFDHRYPSNFLSHVRPVKIDSLLGWIPLPDSENPQAKKNYAIDDDSLRKNGLSGGDAENAILAVGDSFTFGDDVPDASSWPAQLEQLTGRRVYNAGVFAYGTDQIFLRARALIPKLNPTSLIFSFIPQDVDRSALKMMGSFAKPYFRLEKNQLELIPPELTREKWNRVFKGILMRSALFHALTQKSLPPGWWPARTAPTSGPAVTCAILEQLNRWRRETPLKVTVLVQHSIETVDQPDLVETQLHCSPLGGLDILDLAPELRRIKVRSQVEFEKLFRGHMTPEGNRWVAERLKNLLGEQSKRLAGQSLGRNSDSNE